MKRKRRIVIVVLAILFLYFLAWYLPYAFDSLKVAPDTTYLTDGPVVDGQFDFVAALNRRLSEGITPENNAFVKVLEAFGPGVVRSPEVYEWLGIDPLPAEGDYFISLSDYAKANPPPLATGGRREQSGFHYETDDAGEAFRAFLTNPLPLEKHGFIVGFLAANRHALDRLVEASNRTGYYSPGLAGTGETQTHWEAGLYEARSGAHQLSQRIVLRMAQGRHEDAWSDFRAVHHLGLLVRQTPSSDYALIGSGIEGINYLWLLLASETCPLTAEDLKFYLNNLKSLPRFPETVSERLIIDRMMELELWRGIPLARAEPQSVSDILNNTADRFWTISVNGLLRHVNRRFDAYENIWSIPELEARWVAYEALWDEFGIDSDDELTRRNPLVWFIPGRTGINMRTRFVTRTRLGIFSPSTAMTSDAQALADRHIAETALALRIYEREHGAYPETLDALVPALLPSAPADPFPPHGPLVYERTEGGFRLRAGREGSRRSASYEYPFPVKD